MRSRNRSKNIYYFFGLDIQKVIWICRNSRPEAFCKKGVLRNFAKLTGKHPCQRLFLNKVAGLACTFIKKETLAQVLSCEFSKNTFSYGTPLVTAFQYTKNYLAKPEKTLKSPNFPEPHPSKLESQPRILKIIIFLTWFVPFITTSKTTSSVRVKVGWSYLANGNHLGC